jgi:hypothetical protein
MIRLHSRNCLVIAADGTLQSLDGEALRQRLQRAFRTCGISEQWTADHVALTIEEHVASRPDADLAPMAEVDLHAMVLAVLPAAGFEDVGRAYEALVPLPARPPDPDPFRPWERARIEAEVATALPLAEGERCAIVSQVEAALVSLSLTQVRSELIRSLARHFLQQGAAGAAPTAAETPWLLPPGGWPVAAVPDAERLLAAGVLGLPPVSRFLPRLRIELDLRRLASLCGAPPLTELVYLPTVARTLDCVALLFDRAQSAVRALLLPTAAVPAGHLLVCGLEETARSAFPPQSARASQTLCRDLRALVEAKLTDLGSDSLLLTFR